MIDNEVKKTIKKLQKIRPNLERYLDEIIQDIIAEYDNMRTYENKNSRLYLARPLKQDEVFDVNFVIQWFRITFPTSDNKIQIYDRLNYQQWFLNFSIEDKIKLFAMKHDNRTPTKSQAEILKSYKFATYDCEIQN